MTLKAGTSKEVSLTYAAYPQPTASFTFNSGEILDSKRVSYKMAENKVSFVFQKVAKEDAGQYVLTLENAFGKSTAAVTLFVLG